MPIVDPSGFINGKSELTQSFVDQLGKAFEETGFVSVRNYGIPDEIIAAPYHHTQSFFSLPLKQNTNINDLTCTDSEVIPHLAPNTQRVMNPLI